MWNELKNTLKRWFDPEEKEEQKPIQKEERRETEAKTKMTYRYPKQGEFRFPVIPDKQKQSYQKPDSQPPKRQARIKEKEGIKEKKEKKAAMENVNSNSESVKNRPLPETSSIPFTPTDVPSPIYGYHHRQLTSGLDELGTSAEAPVYDENKYSTDDEAWQNLRKRLRSRVSEEKTPTTTIDSGKDENEKQMEVLQEKEENVETVVLEDVPMEASSEGESPEGSQTSSQEDIETEKESTQLSEGLDDPKQNQSDNMEKTSPQETTTYQREEKTIKKKQKNKDKRTVPFNVVMTPRDKRTRDRQKQSQKPVNTSPASKPLPKEEPEREETKKDSERLEYKTPLHLLDDQIRKSDNDETWVTEQMELLETTLRHFHVRAKVVHAMKGPSVTRFEVQPEPGVKVSKITNLADDIKLSMAARDIRIEAPIPGKQAVGIEVPNQQAEMVGLQEIFESPAFQDDPSPLSVGLGLDIGGDPIVTNLKKMPHGLIAGATGSGKSVCINTILISLLYKAHHEDVKFLLIDPKMVELVPYNDLPHLVSPVITDVKAATTALKWAVKEMEDRYQRFVAEGVRDVERFNEQMKKQNRPSEKMPYLVIVIDELADLMMMSPQDVEDAICRIAQKARACGIHLLLATQRPSVDVITGLIKANIPTRIAFSVSSQVDSRTIIDSGGAEKLLGRGDMLFVENGSGQARRIQGAFVSDDEIERVTNHLKKVAPPNYLFHQEELMKQMSSEEDTDEIFEDAVHFVVQHNGASASLIQRRFKVGYNRAARLIDQMEEYGIISAQKGSKPRDVLLTEQQVDELINE